MSLLLHPLLVIAANAVRGTPSVAVHREMPVLLLHDFGRPHVFQGASAYSESPRSARNLRRIKHLQHLGDRLLEKEVTRDREQRKWPQRDQKVHDFGRL